MSLVREWTPLFYDKCIIPFEDPCYLILGTADAHGVNLERHFCYCLLPATNNKQDKQEKMAGDCLDEIQQRFFKEMHLATSTNNNFFQSDGTDSSPIFFFSDDKIIGLWLFF